MAFVFIGLFLGAICADFYFGRKARKERQRHLILLDEQNRLLTAILSNLANKK